METRELLPGEAGGVALHEIYGLSENMRDIARRFADAGYAALAVDLMGQGTARCLALVFAAQLTAGRRGTGGLRWALTLLGKQSGVDATRLGAVGFCMVTAS